MRESRTYGSVRGALSNERPYRVSGLCPLVLLHQLRVWKWQSRPKPYGRHARSW